MPGRRNNDREDILASAGRFVVSSDMILLTSDEDLRCELPLKEFRDQPA